MRAPLRLKAITHGELEQPGLGCRRRAVSAIARRARRCARRADRRACGGCHTSWPPTRGRRPIACKPQTAASGLLTSSAGSRLRGFRDIASLASNCSAKPAIAGVRGVICGQFMALDVQSSRPKWRSDYGQTILKAALNGWDLRLDLRKLVELWGFEPQTSCMPWKAGPFTGVRESSLAARLSWSFVRIASVPFTRIQCGR